jgi:2-isopropylmalate synthase
MSKPDQTPAVTIYDCTLRDGAQGEGISFSLQDKLRIARKLDEIGVHYIEGGWPGSNPKDEAFFAEARDLGLKRARLAAFASTGRKGVPAAEDGGLRTLLAAETPVCTLVGKSWTLHVTEVLRTTLDENLRMIRDSICLLSQHGRDAIYDAEHFFDGYKADPEYALASLQAAADGGASLLVLCDTNGGCLPSDVSQIVTAVRARLAVPVGIHTHNDCELGVANTIAAVQAGAVQVQGTMNGYGERTGNANLCSIVPVLKLKLGLDCISDEDLARWTEASAFMDEIANMPPVEQRPFVGRSAFAHKAGLHVDGLMKNALTFEHVDPKKVGNHRRVLVSELAGKTTIALKAAEFGIDLPKEAPETGNIAREIARLEHEGYVFEDAEASLELLIRRMLPHYHRPFELDEFRTSVDKRGPNGEPQTEATLKLRVEGERTHTVADGDGPVHALDGAMRKALEPIYPALRHVRLTDFKVRVVNVKEGTAAKVRVLVECADERESWSTLGVSENVIEASWLALADALEYALLRSAAPPPPEVDTSCSSGAQTSSCVPQGRCCS